MAKGEAMILLLLSLAFLLLIVALICLGVEVGRHEVRRLKTLEARVDALEAFLVGRKEP